MRPPFAVFPALVSLICLSVSVPAQEPNHLEVVVQSGHASHVTRVALSGDGKRLVTGSYDGTAILWDTASGKQLRTFHDYQHGSTSNPQKKEGANYMSVALTRDGKYVVGSAKGTAFLWEADSGKKLQTFQGHTAIITCLALSHDGKQCITGSDDKTAILWETASGRKLQTFQGQPDTVTTVAERITSVALSRDGKQAVTAAGFNAFVWETAGGTKIQTLQGDTAVFTGVAMSDDGNLVVTGCINGTATLWQADGGKKLQTFGERWAPEYRAISSVALSGDGKHLVTGSYDGSNVGTARLWETSSGKELRTFQGHLGRNVSVALSGDGKYVAAGSLATGSFGRTAILWEAASGKKIQTFQGRADRIGSMAMSRDTTHLVVVVNPSGKVPSNGGKIILWGADGGKHFEGWQGHLEIIDRFTCVALSRDGKQVIGAADRTAILWNAASGNRIKTFNWPYSSVLGVAMSDDGKHVVTGTQHNTAILFESASGMQLRTFQGASSSRTSVAVSGDGKYIVTGGGPPAILWDTAGGKKLQTFPEVFNQGMALSGDGKYLAAGSDSNATLWDTASGKKLETFQGHNGDVTSVAVSGDGKHVVTGSSDNTAISWDASNGKKLQTFQGHTYKIMSVVLSGDGKQLWTASSDGTIRLWDAATGKERCRLISFENGKDWLAVTPAGHFDGSDGARRYVTYRVPGTLTLVDDDATRRRFHRPGLLAQVFKGSEDR